MWTQPCVFGFIIPGTVSGVRVKGVGKYTKVSGPFVA